MLPSSTNIFLDFQDFPHEDSIDKMLSKEAIHKSFNEPLDHIKWKIILKAIFIKQGKNIKKKSKTLGS